MARPFGCSDDIPITISRRLASAKRFPSVRDLALAVDHDNLHDLVEAGRIVGIFGLKLEYRVLHRSILLAVSPIWGWAILVARG